MSRPKLPAKIRTAVALRSRRICCLCYGLLNDSEPKKGQFAHLDHNPKNNKEDNIAYLCLNHHDEYDGISSQSAALTAAEVRHYRTAVYEFVRKRGNAFAIEKKQALDAIQYWTFRKGPTKAEIDAALEFFSGTHRSRAGLMQLDTGPKSIAELQRAIPGEPSWVKTIIDELVKGGWAFKHSADNGRYRISPAGERRLRILDAIPDFIKDAAWRANWIPES